MISPASERPKEASDASGADYYAPLFYCGIAEAREWALS